MTDEPSALPPCSASWRPCATRSCSSRSSSPARTSAVADSSSSSCSSTTELRDRTPELLDKLAATDPRVRVDPPLAQLRPPGGPDSGARARHRRCRRDDRCGPAGPTELIPEMIAAVEPGRRRRLRRAQTARGRDALQARHRLLVLQALRQARPGRPRANSAIPAARPPRARCLLAMTERSRFLRGMTVWIGSPRRPISYERDARHAGETKYTLRKMLRFSLDAITSFSHLPCSSPLRRDAPRAASPSSRSRSSILLRIIGSYCRASARSRSLILLLGGVQLIAIGVIGEYVGRIYDEVKHRPLYIVREELNRPSACAARRARRASAPGCSARTPQRTADLRSSRARAGAACAGREAR